MFTLTVIFHFIPSLRHHTSYADHLRKTPKIKKKFKIKSKIVAEFANIKYLYTNFILKRKIKEKNMLEIEVDKVCESTNLALIVMSVKKFFFVFNFLSWDKPSIRNEIIRNSKTEKKKRE